VLRINNPTNIKVSSRPARVANHARKDPKVLAAKEAAIAATRQKIANTYYKAVTRRLT
jgi:hypothetical protein